MQRGRLPLPRRLVRHARPVWDHLPLAHGGPPAHPPTRSIVANVLLSQRGRDAVSSGDRSEGGPKDRQTDAMVSLLSLPVLILGPDQTTSVGLLHFEGFRLHTVC
jgi:hypothetical protein